MKGKAAKAAHEKSNEARGLVKKEEITKKKKDRQISTTPPTTRKPQPTTKANPSKKQQPAKSPDAPLPSSAAAADAAPSSLEPSPSSAAAPDGRQIDALFSRLKRKHKAEPTHRAKTSATSGGAKVRGDSVARRGRRPKQKQPSSIDEDLSLANRPRRYTEEGWPIYTEDELRIGTSDVHQRASAERQAGSQAGREADICMLCARWMDACVIQVRVAGRPCVHSTVTAASDGKRPVVTPCCMVCVRR